jgi:D-3-phosphoglycerate dehydrogenase
VSAETSPSVLLTDRAWPDDNVEREVVEAAGLALVSGPPDAAPATTIERLVAEHQPAAIMTCWAQVSAAAIAASPGLRVVARMGVGLDNIAVEAATECGVLVTNVPDYCVEEASDHAVGLVLGTRVIASDPFPPVDTHGIPMVSLDELLHSSDAVILHAPLTPATRHLIGSRELSLVPRGALLVNVARGGLVDTRALIEALHDGRLGGAGLDVLETEPEVPRELLQHPGDGSEACRSGRDWSADCKAAGIHRMVKLTHALIAATAIEHGLPVVTRDDDYDRIAAAHTPLRVIKV